MWKDENKRKIRYKDLLSMDFFEAFLLIFRLG